MPNGGGSHSLTINEAAGAADALVVNTSGVSVAYPEAGGAADRLATALAAPLPDAAGAAEALSWQPGLFPRDAAAGVDDIPGVSFTVAETIPAAAADKAGAAEGLRVTKGTAPAPAPVPAARIAAPVFILTGMPRMHLQNVLTGAWVTREVRGITQPSITWNLNQPDTFTCQVSPPQPALLDATGNPICQEWQHACYLEQDGEIKFGGILTSSGYAGPAWTPTFTGFAGYPTGIPYEGASYHQRGVDSLDVVRYLWAWVQSQPSSNLGMVLDPLKSGVQLGVQLAAGAIYAATTLAAAIKPGDTQITVVDPSGGFATGQLVQVAGDSTWRTIQKISKNTFTMSSAYNNGYAKGSTVVQGGKTTVFALDWWNSTDVGQEIASILSDTVCDWWEQHTWTDSGKQGVRHALHFGVPRIGIRQATLRFAEGENIISPVQTSRDGTSYASEVVGLGSGQGSAQIRAQVASPNGRLRRVFVYTDQTIRSTGRMQSRAQKILASRIAIDTPAQVVVRNHPNAPFGSFRPGDDILITQAQGWRNAQTWARITQIQQDPTSNVITLTCARSDSFTYLAESGQAGSL
jgi:hypothetical protein